MEAVAYDLRDLRNVDEITHQHPQNIISYSNSETLVHLEITYRQHYAEYNRQAATLMFNQYRYYPVLSLLMLIPSIVILTLLSVYFLYDFVTVNPIILIWGLIGFAGMYIVIWSASKELKHEKEKNKFF